MTATCPSCGCEQGAALLCASETDALERDLAAVPALVADLDIAISKQARIGAGGRGGLARERMPIGWGAVMAADNLGNVLTTWARDVAGDKGLPIATVAGAARILLLFVPSIRRHAAVVELVDEISDAIKQARHAIDRPADRAYLGQCYVETPDDDGRMITCLNELYGRPNATDVQCKVCGTEHPVAERRAWLLQRAADMLVTVKEAASYIGEVGGIKVTESSIRGYLHRGARLAYRAPVEAKRFRMGDLLAVVLDESEKKSA